MQKNSHDKNYSGLEKLELFSDKLAQSEQQQKMISESFHMEGKVSRGSLYNFTRLTKDRTYRNMSMPTQWRLEKASEFRITIWNMRCFPSLSLPITYTKQADHQIISTRPLSDALQTLDYKGTTIFKYNLACTIIVTPCWFSAIFLAFGFVRSVLLFLTDQADWSP